MGRDKKTETTEQIAAGILNQDPFEVKIGSKRVMFNKLSLSDREKISAYASLLPVLDNIRENDNILFEGIHAGRYAKILARIITIASKPKSNWIIGRRWHIGRQKKKIFRALMHEPMDMVDLYEIYIKIAKQINPSFFLDIIISLRGTNHLKPTTGTAQTAPIQ